MEHFLFYSLIICIASLATIFLDQTPEGGMSDTALSSPDSDNAEPQQSASAQQQRGPTMAYYLSELEEEHPSNARTSVFITLPELPRAVSDNQNPYY